MLVALREWTRVCPLWLPEKPATAPADIERSKLLPVLMPSRNRSLVADAFYLAAPPGSLKDVLDWILEQAGTRGRRVLVTSIVTTDGHWSEWRFPTPDKVRRRGVPLKALDSRRVEA